VGTVVRGHSVMWQGELVMPSVGQPMRFLEVMAAQG
jgi:dihydroorotase